MQDVNEVAIHVVNLSLMNLCYLMVLSLITASLAHFIQYCLKPGEILGRYGVWLNYHWIYNWRKSDRWKRPILKPLGLCVYCNGAWVFIVLLLVNGWLYSGVISFFIGLFLGLGANYIWIKILDKI